MITSRPELEHTYYTLEIELMKVERMTGLRTVMSETSFVYDKIKRSREGVISTSLAYKINTCSSTSSCDTLAACKAAATGMCATSLNSFSRNFPSPDQGVSTWHNRYVAEI